MNVTERIPVDSPLPEAHPWVRRFLARPQKAFDQLISGAAIIDPYYSLEPEDVLCILAGDAPPEHVFWDKLNEQTLRWLNERRGWSAEKRAAYGLNAYVGGVVGVISIVGRLNLTGVIDDFKKNYGAWMRWAADLRLGSSHDPYWAIAATVALQQTEQDGGRFVRRWHELIENAGQADGWSDARNGLAALRHVPSKEQPPKEWLLGFARFAATLPDSKEARAAFERIWREETIFFPRGPGTWRKLAAPYFDSHLLKDKPALNWWKEQVKWSKEWEKKENRTPERSPMPSEAQAVIRKLGGDNWRQGVEEGKALIRRSVAFAEKTGDAYYLVRTCVNLGKAAIPVDPQWAHDLARTNLLWAPNDNIGWTLWMRALARLGDARSAELAAWEALRRFPEDPIKRNAMGEVLAKQPERRTEAEAVFRETIYSFPDNVVARAALGNLLLEMGPERLAEAEACFNAVLEIDPGDRYAGPGLKAVTKARGGERKPATDETPPPDRADAFAAEVAGLRPDALCQRADATLTLLGNDPVLRDRSDTDLAEVLRAEPSHPFALMLQARNNPDMRAKLGDAATSWGLNLYAAQGSNDIAAFNRLTKTAPERRPVVLLARRMAPVRDGKEDSALAGFVNEVLRDGADAALLVTQNRLRRMTGWRDGRGVSTADLTAALDRGQAECDALLWDVAKLTAVRGALPFAD
jgi:tetratricopeptide (TPR) repeat protein